MEVKPVRLAGDVSGHPGMGMPGMQFVPCAAGLPLPACCAAALGQIAKIKRKSSEKRLPIPIPQLSSNKVRQLQVEIRSECFSRERGLDCMRTAEGTAVEPSIAAYQCRWYGTPADRLLGEHAQGKVRRHKGRTRPQNRLKSIRGALLRSTRLMGCGALRPGVTGHGFGRAGSADQAAQHDRQHNAAATPRTKFFCLTHMQCTRVKHCCHRAHETIRSSLAAHADFSMKGSF
jgi:hypothetical protein